MKKTPTVVTPFLTVLSAIFMLLLACCTNAQGPAGKGKSQRSEMVLIAKTSFLMGTDEKQIPELMKLYGIYHPELFSGESPRHKVTLSAYFIDKYEVTNRDFEKFVKSNPKWSAISVRKDPSLGEYLKDWKDGKAPKDLADHPVTYITWQAATAYCRSVGKRLPTEAEWEYAATGGLKDMEFPWGDKLSPANANYGESGFETTTKVGSYKPNGFGIYDLAGNVWEYLADEWGDYSPSPAVDPLAGAAAQQGDGFLSVDTRRVIRGGSWGGAPVNLRVRYRDSHRPRDPKPFVGFRCAASARSD